MLIADVEQDGEQSESSGVTGSQMQLSQHGTPKRGGYQVLHIEDCGFNPFG